MTPPVPSDPGDRDRWARMGALLGLTPEAAAEVELATANPDAYFARHDDELLQRGIEEPEMVSPWLALIDGLLQSGDLAYLDWSATVDDLAADLLALPRVAHLPGDALDDVDATGEDVENAFAPADRVLAQHGLRLLQLDEDSDAYPLVVVPSENVSEIIALASELGHEARSGDPRLTAGVADAATPPVATATPPAVAATPPVEAPRPTSAPSVAPDSGAHPVYAAPPTPPFAEHQRETAEQWRAFLAAGREYSVAPDLDTSAPSPVGTPWRSRCSRASRRSRSAPLWCLQSVDRGVCSPTCCSRQWCYSAESRF